MSLPPGFLDELRTRTSLSQVVGRKVMWDPRKSNQGKGDWWAPCPFHQEKSASFHVDDRKGFYYCFGCGAKGDAITFVRETENVEFMEAIKILAWEAGLPVPASDPRAQEKADLRSQLVAVMEQAVQFYRLQLKTSAAAEAREYLERRGLGAKALERWEIGFSAPGWQNLWDHLTAKGAKPEHILACGLAKPSDKGKKPYDTFRHRIMFPIRDARGRAIAFGGRAMDPNDNAKYLNSPETPLFDKGRNLYNHGPAREAAGKGQPLIVAEGYMDVIALSEAGFTASVAPLGTAVTEPQLQLMWRIAPEPLIALDGDTAGLRAANRVMDLAFPLIEAGQSLRFALMPEGQDPDDLIRAQGPAAMQARLDQALPMVHLLWQRETTGKVFDSPERKAALDKDLRNALRQIKDPSLRGHYAQDIKDLRWKLFAPTSRGSKGRKAWNAPPTAQASTKSSLLAGAAPTVTDRLREAVILATLIANPQVIDEFDAQIEALTLTHPDHDALRSALLSADPRDASGDLRDQIVEQMGPQPLENLFGLAHVAISPAVRQAGDTDLARQCLSEEFAKLKAHRGHAQEVRDAEEDLSGTADEGLTYRLAQAADALTRAGRQTDDDDIQYQTAPNGAKLSKEEQSSLDTLLEKINYGKSKKD